MQKKIKNREALLSHGDIDGRKIVLDITEKTLQHLDAYERIKSIARMEGDVLCIGSRRWDLSKKRNVYLLGAGKACNHMAMAIDEILGEHLTRGIAIVKIKEDTDVFRRTDVYVGGHPLPNEEGLRACKEIIKLVDSANEDDLFIVVISGGIFPKDSPTPTLPKCATWQGRSRAPKLFCATASSMMFPP